MTVEELDETYRKLKEEDGLSDEDIVKALGVLFEQDEISKDELRALIHRLGYDFTPEFEKLDGEEAKKNLWKEEEKEPEDEDIDEGEVSDLEESGEEEAPESKDEDEDKKEEDSESEDDEKKKAFELMGL